MTRRKISILFILLGIGIAFSLPQFVQSNYVLRIAVASGLFILLASAHNILMKVGQLSLGPVAFYGLGAYVSAILSTRYGVPFVICFLAAGVSAAVAGWIIGRLTLKLRIAYFVLVTIGFAEFFRLVALNWTAMTNGPMGITAIPAPALWFKGYAMYYYFILFLVLIVLFGLYRLENSTIGRAMQAIRENEVLGQSVGIDSYRYMMLAAVLSSFIIGIAGSFYAHFFQFLGPEILSFELTITIVVMVIAGGRATLAGPVLGAILFTIIPELLRAATVWRMVIYGALLVTIMLFMPDGIMPSLVSVYQKLRNRFRPAGEPSDLRTTLEIFDTMPQNTGCRQEQFAVSTERCDKEEICKEASLIVEDLCVYFGGVHAVEHVSLSVYPGEILAIIGPNGAGKTTLLNAITRLGPITSGMVHYLGEELNALKAHETAHRHIVRTFQHTSVFPNLTTYRNMVLAHNALEPTGLVTNVFRTSGWHDAEQEIRRRADEILEFTNLKQYVDCVASSLPYGAQRLLEMGIALVADPNLLLLDEPAAGMNPTEVEALMELILRIKKMGITVVLVEHDMKLVMGISDRVAVINYGELLAEGTPEEICQDDKVIQAYLGRCFDDAQTL
ncbi:MAG: hypothetical protein CVU41_17735 [Chloroflexi bacterium HGW-Chloroflexi-3]|nr:MAG: hypothetical protein CVU41_17735 [Chloroflexi bacterium HGW-Chloroflexi-3]